MAKKNYGGSFLSGVDLSDPGVIISLVVIVTVLVKIALVMFPQLLAAVRDMENLSGFQFASLFASSGVFDILLSVLLFAGLAGVIGFNVLKRRKR